MDEKKREYVSQYDKSGIEELIEKEGAAERRFNEEFKIQRKGRKKRITRDIKQEGKKAESILHRVQKEQQRNFRKTGI